MVIEMIIFVSNNCIIIFTYFGQFPFSSLLICFSYENKKEQRSRYTEKAHTQNKVVETLTTKNKVENKTKQKKVTKRKKHTNKD